MKKKNNMSGSKQHTRGSKGRASKGDFQMGSLKGLAVTAPSSITTSADVTKVRLKYFASLNDFSTSSTYYGHVFRLNSLYDPDYSGAGASVVGFSQWSTLYKEYRVLATHVKISQVATATGVPGIIYGCYPMIGTSTETVLENALTKPRAKYSEASWSATTARPIKSHLPIHSSLGLTKEQYYTDLTTSALVTTNPTSVLYCNVFAYNITGVWGASASNNPTLFVEFTFDVEFFGRQDLDQTFRLMKEVSLALGQTDSKEVIDAVTLRRKLLKQE